MEVGVLGPTQVRRGNDLVDLGTRKQRGLLAALSLYAGKPVSTDAIIDLLWADDPPATVTGTLQAYVSGLRRSLEPSRGRRAPSALLVTVGSGYALRIPPDQLDAGRFTAIVSAQHQRLGSVAALVPQPSARARPDRSALQDAVDELDAALALWRGEPYGGLSVNELLDIEGLRLRELYASGLRPAGWLGFRVLLDAYRAAEMAGLVSVSLLGWRSAMEVSER